MNAGEAPANVADSQRRELRLVSGLVWFILISTGWVLFELTANPALSAVVACLKFGWNDWLTARWMRRTDPNRARGGTYFWFLLGNALWRVIGTALVVSFLIPMVEEVAQPAGGKQFEDVLRTLMALVILGPLVASMVTLIAVGLALKRGVTVWIDPTLHWFRRNNMWPPQPWGRRSPLELQISLSMGLWLLVALIVLVTMGFHPQGWLPFGDGPKLIILMICLIAGPAIALSLRERILEAIVASAPFDCWDADGALHEI